MAEARPIAFVGARLVDPASGYDGPGAVISAGGAIAEVVQRPALEGLSPDIELVDCGGAMLAPGLVDIRVKTGEPGPS
jgi:dihydroorotase